MFGYQKGADIEAGTSGGTGTAAPTRGLYPGMTESPELRWALIRKIYVILSLQLLLTAVVAAVVVKVFLFVNSKCKHYYFRNRLKPTKLTCRTMYMKQHKKEYRSKTRLTSLCPVKEIITKRSCSQLDLTFVGKTLRGACSSIVAIASRYVIHAYFCGSGDGKEALSDEGSLKSKAKSGKEALSDEGSLKSKAKSG